MACGQGRTSGCEEIYKIIYPTLVSEIDSSMATVNLNLNNIVSTLSGLKVPDDYLGQKVQSQINNLCNTFSEDTASVSAEKGLIDSFVSGKIELHRRHHAQYLAMLEEQKKEKEESI